VTLKELEARIRVLEDIEAIKKLRARYCFYADDFKQDEWVSLFAEDAKVDFGLMGTYEGKEGITAFFRDVVAVSGSFYLHMCHNPFIEVDGDRARGRWYFEVPATLRGTEQALWLGGKYEEEYVKVRGEWKFKFLRAVFDYMTPYEAGWAKTPFWSLQTS